MTNPKILPDDYFETFTVAQVAEKFHVGERVVRDWISGGKLKAKKIGRQLFVTKAELKRFVAPDV